MIPGLELPHPLQNSSGAIVDVGEMWESLCQRAVTDARMSGDPSHVWSVQVCKHLDEAEYRYLVMNL